MTLARYRKIDCPDPEEGVFYRLINPVTGEVLESGDVVLILRKMVSYMDSDPKWQNVEVRFERITREGP